MDVHFFADKSVYPREGIMQFLEEVLAKAPPGTVEELIFEIDLLRLHAIDRECFTPTILFYLKEAMIAQTDSLKRLHLALFRDEDAQPTMRNRMVSSTFLHPAFMALTRRIEQLRAATHVSLRGGIAPVEFHHCRPATIVKLTT